jgi:rhomboid family protein
VGDMPISQRFRLWFYAQPQAIRTLLAINVVAYLLWQVIFIQFDASRSFVWSYLALNPSLPGILYRPWELLTYSFLHLQTGFGGLLHILFNMLWMLWIGREYEQMHGPRRIVALYIYGGIGGAIVTVILHSIFPQIGSFGGVVHGASGSVLGIMTAIAIQYRQKSIALMFIGVVRLLHVVIGFLALDILFMAGGGTSVSAHLGGALAGYLCGRALLAGVDISGWLSLFVLSQGGGGRGGRSGRGPGHLAKLEQILGRRAKSERRPSGAAQMRVLTEEEINESSGRSGTGGDSQSSRQEKVDELLDKISEGGYESLSRAEKRILFEASKEDEE